MDCRMILISFLYYTVQLLLVLFAIFLALSVFTGAPFIPTPQRVVREMIDIARINSHDIVIDLGSGDGRLLISAAKKGARAIGWEINPVLVIVTKLRIHFSKVSDRADVHWGDFRHADTSSATVILLYAITSRMNTIEEKLKRELKPGTKIVSYIFRFPHLTERMETDSGIHYYCI